MDGVFLAQSCRLVLGREAFVDDVGLTGPDHLLKEPSERP